MSSTPNSLHARRRRFSDDSSSTLPDPKRQKIIDARTISTQSVDGALVNGELDVGKFVKAREFAITALDEALKSAKTALSTRAFQELPISMRRRTASHNVKRLPKRIRARALREVSSQVVLGLLF
jgi:ribonuclease P/MRP protein subunit POP1